jgi:hypothetical protein
MGIASRNAVSRANDCGANDRNDECGIANECNDRERDECEGSGNDDRVLHDQIISCDAIETRRSRDQKPPSFGGVAIVVLEIAHDMID